MVVFSHRWKGLWCRVQFLFFLLFSQPIQYVNLVRFRTKYRFKGDHNEKSKKEKPCIVCGCFYVIYEHFR